ncbi:MAG: selenocysteine-specific translation elongation factor [Blastocatellia bacterium]
MKRIIVGTAGHIDHGKTSLVRALTGVDTDRLKEEKERGITIDLGFADLSVGDVHFGFVDVPGHERFVRNMLAGAHGLDIVTLVVAADEGVMPQTREHFDICRLLEIRAGLVVITKIDMADEELTELVEADVEEFVAGSFLQGAPVLRVSARTGQGIDELKKTLTQMARKVADRDAGAIARLPIDRVFTIKGFGTVVTGTLIAGQIRLGDELELAPTAGRRAKVRGLQSHGKSAPEAQAGERTAVNLSGIDVDEISRGQTLVPAGRLQATHMLDVRLHLLKNALRPLRTRARVRLHHGTAEILARVSLPGHGEIAPGGTGYAQLRLESPVLAAPGDHYILRSYSPAMTIGGGTIIDAMPQKHRLRDGPRVTAQLEKLEAAGKQQNETERMALFVEMAGERGMTIADIAARTGGSDTVIQQAMATLTKSRRLVSASANPPMLIAQTAFNDLAKRTRELLKEFHRRAPLESGMGREELRERVFTRLPAEIFRAVIASLSERSEIVAEKDLLRLASHRIELSAAEKALRDYIGELYARAALQPATMEESLADAAKKFATETTRAQRFAQMLINSGDLIRVADMLFHRTAIETLRGTLQQYKASHGPRMDVAAFKDLTGVSRKYAIPLLEYLDRQRITRRAGDVREIL